MEEEKTSAVETETTETTEKVEETKSEEETKKEEKTFTQDEFNTALQKEVARKTKGIPSKEELKAYNEWKESQKTEAEKQNEKEKEYDSTKKELEFYKRKDVVLDSNVDKKFAKFVISEVASLDGDFEENLSNYLKENPQYLVSSEPKETKTVDLGSEHDDKKTDDDSLARKVMGLK